MRATAKQPGADVRIVNLTSEGHNLARSAAPLFDKAKLDWCNAWGRYGCSKLANILYTRALAEREPEIMVTAVHPGLIKAELYAPNQESNWVLRWGLLVGGWVRQGPEEGAWGQVWAATAKKADGKGEGVDRGAYYTPVANKSGGSGLARDEKLKEKFWEWTEGQLAEKRY